MTHSARQEEYASPFSARYCSPELSHLFSLQWRALTFRRLWIALAKAQHKHGLPITPKQIAQMESAATHIDFDKIHTYEKKFRHDVMAHIHAFGDACPDAKPIIHLGATSSYVTDNADLIQLKEALSLLFQKLLHVLQLLSRLAAQHQSDPCLSYTHFQAAQPTTIGKRLCLWLQDFLLDAQDWSRLLDNLPFFGLKGATGTQASFLSLFNNDHHKILQLEQELAATFHFQHILPISGQTYTRKLDLSLLNALSSFAASAHKCATDLRLLAHEQEILEPLDPTQVGSSAMPYKRNPIYSERICGLARFTISLSQNPAYTLATQWLERSLDDSSNRRLAIPESFLATDAILNLLFHIFSSPHIQTTTSLQHLHTHLPHLCMENILMLSTKKGASRQHLHEKLRNLSHHHDLATLFAAVVKDPDFRLTHPELEALTQLPQLIGRAPEQVAAFLKTDVHPFLHKHPPGKISIPAIEL